MLPRQQSRLQSPFNTSMNLPPALEFSSTPMVPPKMEYQVLDNEFDVLVVGAGPVGLWVACELALAKVNVAVLERRAEPVGQSRGLAIQGRTLEVFALRGLADRFLARGRPIPKGHFGLLGTGLDFSVVDTSFQFKLVQPQVTTEVLLE